MEGQGGEGEKVKTEGQHINLKVKSQVRDASSINQSGKWVSSVQASATVCMTVEGMAFFTHISVFKNNVLTTWSRSVRVD